MHRVLLFLLFTGFFCFPVILPAEITDDLKFSFAFSERIRQESWDNINSLNQNINDGYSYLRFKSLFKVQLNFKKIEFAVQLANESRIYFNPKRNFKFHEIFIDQFYLNWQEILPNLSFKLGRFDLRWGEGFLFADGTPLDGSRSYYFNGMISTYKFNSKTKLNLFLFYQTHEEEILPLLLDRDQLLEEQKTISFGLYNENKFRRLSLETYLFHKAMLKDQDLDGYLQSDLTNLGARAIYPFSSCLTLTAEGTLQFGKFHELKAFAWGGYFYFTCQSKKRLPFPQTLTAGLIFLSGDNQQTPDRYEGWDPVFSRWPKWSDSFIYVLAKETGNAYWTNLFSPYLQLTFNLNQSSRLELLYYKLLAMTEGIPSNYCSGSGTNRGDLFCARYFYTFNAHLKGHLIYEFFNPRNFYRPDAANCNWLRFEMTFSF